MATAKTPRIARAAKAAAPKPAGDNKALKVVPKIDGFRRCGRAFSGETLIPLGQLTDEEYEQLTTEPMLVTALVDAPTQAEADAT